MDNNLEQQYKDDLIEKICHMVDNPTFTVTVVNSVIDHFNTNKKTCLRHIAEGNYQDEMRTLPKDVLEYSKGLLEPGATKSRLLGREIWQLAAAPILAGKAIQYAFTQLNFSIPSQITCRVLEQMPVSKLLKIKMVVEHLASNPAVLYPNSK